MAAFKTVCICGSMRFYPQMLKVAEAETAAGRIVLMPFVTKGDTQRVTRVDEDMLDLMHREKITMSDEVILITDMNEYVGDSTQNELKYACVMGIPVRVVHCP